MHLEVQARHAEERESYASMLLRHKRPLIFHIMSRLHLEDTFFSSSKVFFDKVDHTPNSYRC